MEFKEYGPLAQSKEMANSKKTSWVPLVLMLGLGVIIGATYINMAIQNQYNISK
jgi:CHASE1-domain containing sensor protein